jgi:hypothetical protein
MKTIKPLHSLVFAALLSTVALPASAASFSGTLTDAIGPLDGGVVTRSITSDDAGAAVLTFDLLGYNTIDGDNQYKDTFNLKINGTLVFSGGFDMGGLGGSFTNFIDSGVTIVSTSTPGLDLGGLTKFSVAHNLLAGANTYEFDYGQMQGLSDEGWGLRAATISSTNVPEPFTIIGTCIGGTAAFRMRKKLKSSNKA